MYNVSVSFYPSRINENLKMIYNIFFTLLFSTIKKMKNEKTKNKKKKKGK